MKRHITASTPGDNLETLPKPFRRSTNDMDRHRLWAEPAIYNVHDCVCSQKNKQADDEKDPEQDFARVVVNIIKARARKPNTRDPNQKRPKCLHIVPSLGKINGKDQNLTGLSIAYITILVKHPHL